MFVLPCILNSADKLQIIVNTNKLVLCERGYIQIKALNTDNSLDNNWNGMVEVKSSNPLTSFRNEQEEKDYTGKITFSLVNGTNQMGDNTGTRGIGFWDFNPQTIKLTASAINDNLTPASTNVSIVNFNSTSNIIINEIMYRTVDDDKYEWIELYNNSSKDISLKNFRLQRYSYNTYESSAYTITSSSYIKAKSFAILCKGIGNLNTFFPDVNTNNAPYRNITVIEGLSLELANDTPLFLIDPSGRYCDGLIYESSWGNKTTYNISIERKDYNTPAYLKQNWDECVSTEYLNYGAKGTPGKENSIIKRDPEQELKINVSLNKKVFSSKENEFLEIKYSLTEYAKVTIKVFNSAGNEIIQLLRHQDSGTEETTLRFYGKDSDNKLLSPGIYILYFEALNSDTGKTATKAVSFVVGNKL